MGKLLLAPTWQPQPVMKPPAPASLTATTVIVGGSSEQRERWQRQFPMARIVANAEASEWDHEIVHWAGRTEHLIWIMPEPGEASELDESFLSQTYDTVLTGFALIKALLRASYGQRSFTLTAISTMAQAVHVSDSIHPAQAAVHGLIGSLAKEYPNWSVRLIDLAPPMICPSMSCWRCPGTRTETRGVVAAGSGIGNG